MICDVCKLDGYGCSFCGRPVASRKDGAAYVHRNPVRCPGSGKQLKRHPNCGGCTCQHKPKGSWNAGK